MSRAAGGTGEGGQTGRGSMAERHWERFRSKCQHRLDGELGARRAWSEIKGNASAGECDPDVESLPDLIRL